MKKTILPFLFFFVYHFNFAQTSNYWQQKVDYTISVKLNDVEKTLDGLVSFSYQNNSPDTLNFIWIHLWPNAYKNDKTAFSEQMLQIGRTDFYFSDEDKKGYINQLDFKADQQTVSTVDHPLHQDIIKLILPKPLLPGNKTIIETPFHEKLPFNFSRGGFRDSSFQITQWYPKPAVYDKYGWHEMPYLDQGEFYSEYGSFDVKILLNKDFKIAATGILIDSSSDQHFRTVHYYQDSIHDFAWFADKNYTIIHDTLQLKSKIIDVYAYHYNDSVSREMPFIDLIKMAIISKSQWIGEYPYKIVTVVESSNAGSSGMEYPTITLIDKTRQKESLQFIINHEVGHNWFYGILGSNERSHPWMDEGLNTYYDKKYENSAFNKYALPQNKNLRFLKNKIPSSISDLATETICKIKKDQPITTSAEAFSTVNYDLIAYNKTGLWMQELENNLGSTSLDSLMHLYFDKWKFKHPQPEDFKSIFTENASPLVNKKIQLLDQKGIWFKKEKRHLKVSGIFNFKETKKYNYLFFSPAIAYNQYDKIMPGVIFHNYTFPPNNFQFFIAPLYSLAAKQWNGIGRFGYDIYPKNNAEKLNLSISFSSFNNDTFEDSAAVLHFLRFQKIVPSIKYTFANKEATSEVKKFIQWKSFFIKETGLASNRDTIQNTNTIYYPVIGRYLNQLQFEIQNNRILYPYSANLTIEQGKYFIKFGASGNYYFNYKSEGGLYLRWFAGKFFYTAQKNIFSFYETERYHFNLSGANGYEDYHYNNYFIGRNEYEGFSSKQIMIRDGGFKVRSELLSSKIGKTDQWLAAINLCTTIPQQYNPLAVLPVKIPIRLFVDLGSYAEAWGSNATSEKILYDAGFQLSFFKNLVNIYFPIAYSKTFRNYFTSTYNKGIFYKNISFSIDIQNISLKHFFSKSPL